MALMLMPAGAPLEAALPWRAQQRAMRWMWVHAGEVEDHTRLAGFTEQQRRRLRFYRWLAAQKQELQAPLG